MAKYQGACIVKKLQEMKSVCYWLSRAALLALIVLRRSKRVYGARHTFKQVDRLWWKHKSLSRRVRLRRVSPADVMEKKKRVCDNLRMGLNNHAWITFNPFNTLNFHIVYWSDFSYTRPSPSRAVAVILHWAQVSHKFNFFMSGPLTHCQNKVITICVSHRIRL